MKRFFSPNISRAGRIVRGAMAAVFLLAAIFAPLPALLRVLLFASALFTGFEALRGWCVLRACGIRTRL